MLAIDFRIISQVYQIQGKVKNFLLSRSKIIKDKRVVEAGHQEVILAIAKIVLGLRLGKISRGKIWVRVLYCPRDCFMAYRDH